MTHNPKYIYIAHKKCIQELLNRFGMIERNPLSTPMEQNLSLTPKERNEFEDVNKYRYLVGSPIYLTTTKEDISFVVGILSNLMQKCCEWHFFATKRVLKYLKRTHDLRLKYSKVDGFKDIGYFVLEFDHNKENGVPTLCYLMSLGSTIFS